MIETLHALLLESLLSTVKHNSHLLVAPLLVESLWSWWEAGCTVRSTVVLAWARYFKLQALAEENLVEVETRRGGVESYLFASRLFEVWGSGLMKPVRVGVRRYSETSNLVFDA
jgi:hypothetical protein